MDFEELINMARQSNCSDVHITVGTSLALRRYGVLTMLPEVPTKEESTELIMCNLTAKDRQKLENGEDLDFAMFTESGIRLRANVYHQRNNIAATYRLLNDRIPSFEELMVPDAIRNLVKEPRGLVLITGPTGSGKSTTLASMVDYINHNMAKHIITIEDPIEYVYPHARSMIHQREVGKDVGSFAGALRSALREDPDIILVGEMRDFETIQAAITAAETGQLVLATLHTQTAPQTIERILDTYPPHSQGQARTQLSNVLKGVCTQILVPRDDEPGMIMASEVMVNTPAIAAQIREDKTHQLTSSIQGGLSLGMHTLNADLKRLVREQYITLDTAIRYCNNPKEFDDFY